MRAHVIGNVTTKLMISSGESRSVGERGRRHGERRKRERQSEHHHRHQRGEEVLLTERILSEREPEPVFLCVVTTKPSLLATMKATNRREAASRHNATLAVTLNHNIGTGKGTFEILSKQQSMPSRNVYTVWYELERGG